MPDRSRGVASRRVAAIRWELRTRRPYPAWAGILATDRLRHLVVSGLDESTDPEDFLLTGHGAGPLTEHRFGYHAHAHWLWIEDDEQHVVGLALWCRPGLAAPQRDRVLSVRRLSRPDFNDAGFQPGDLSISGVGSAADALPELGSGLVSTAWASAVPYLLTLHTKRSRQWEDVVAQDVQRYLDHYYGVGAVRLITLQFGRAASNYRTSRWDPADSPSEAVWIERMEVDVPLTGPVCLGRHSHFGFGRFVPLADGLVTDPGLP
ncbi:Hypothetical protein PROPJV5_2370 [Propionibacterium ruminifibrarum]|uniref:CRISPR-associated protein Cas6 C-terminal domain-containing protein n=1 Tax=Propionibacterium ruminifibrarum TaxID=1962131 RepID=A0A375I3E9_9ACTN|nr:hypothetical protein [Propionibacterium ruminifibrarum]SPF69421.1 Hypothetical protein PROPJV5_2370 [Propionibacterium ruminifibrarum]